MSQWCFYYDQTRCVGCNGCVMACKSWNEERRGDAAFNVPLSWIESGKYAVPSEYDGLPGSTGEQNYEEYRKYHMKEDWRRVTTNEYGTALPDVDILNISLSCNHCDKPACKEVCPMQIISKDPDTGIVLVDNTNCISCGKCKDACPWGAPQFYDANFRKYAENDPQRPKMTKCTLCLDRIRDGLKPACVAACLTRALDAEETDKLKAKYPNAVPSVENFPSDSVASLGISTKPNIIFKPRTRRA